MYKCTRFFHVLCPWHSMASLPCPASRADCHLWQLPLLDPAAPAESPPLAAVSGSLKAGVEPVSNHYFPQKQARRGVKTHRLDLQLLRRDAKGGSLVRDHKAMCSREGAGCISRPPPAVSKLLRQLLPLGAACLTPLPATHLSTGLPHPCLPEGLLLAGGSLGYKEGNSAAD